jgi:hypothetical protein
VNSLEIPNPGEPIVPVERFIDGYQSRNERFASLIRRMGSVRKRAAVLVAWCSLLSCTSCRHPIFGLPVLVRLSIFLGLGKFGIWIGMIESGLATRTVLLNG